MRARPWRWRSVDSPRPAGRRLTRGLRRGGTFARRVLIGRRRVASAAETSSPGTFGLAPRVEPEPIDELDPLQRGAFIHDVQFALLARLRQDGLLPISPRTLARAQEALGAAIA